jgi:hypothetical protein
MTSTTSKVAAPVVRTATKEPELLRLLRLMHAEGGLTPLDEDCARGRQSPAVKRLKTCAASPMSSRPRRRDTASRPRI